MDAGATNNHRPATVPAPPLPPPVEPPTGPAATECTEQRPALSTDSGNTGKKYRYSKLPPGSIRLLHLMPHEEDGAPVRCHLFDYPIRKTGERGCVYEALSYCWGAPEKLCSIFIGESGLPVTANLYAALLRLRDHFVGRVIWVDAICINQDDIEERGEQVRSMAEIYYKASCVTVWLGEARADDHGTLEAICAAGDEFTKSPGRKTEQEAVLALLNRPWFRRIWVLQEVAAARHIRVMCGSAEVDGYAFCLGLEAHFGLRSPLHSVTYLITRSIFRPRLRIDLSGRASLGICPLGELIDLYHTHEATERHDKVYALLGMSSDAPSTTEAAGLSPDYRIPWEELLKRLVRFFLGRQVSVHTWPERETVVIQGKGYVLGKVSSVDGGRMRLAPETSLPPKEWAGRPSPRSLRVGDLVCLLQGASIPMIIRPRKDYFSVILISAAPLDDTGTDSVTAGQPEQSFLRDFLLVWAWEGSQVDPQERDEYESAMKMAADDHLDEEGGTSPAKVIRLWNAALILRDADLHDAAEWRLQEMDGSCESVPSALYDWTMVGAEKGPMPDPEYSKKVLSALYLANRPLSLPELALVAGLPPNIDPRTLIEKCDLIQTTKDGKVHLMHQAAEGYLDQHHRFRLRLAGRAQWHADIARRSIDEMSHILRRNIYSIELDSKPQDVSPPHPDPLASIRYSCVFWVSHLCFRNDSDPGFKIELADGGRVFEFLKEHLLHWLEALSLLGKLPDGLRSVQELLRVARIHLDTASGLVGFLEDAAKFISHHEPAIKRAPLQMYGSALVFSPALSEVREQQWSERLSLIKSAAGPRDHWGTCPRTLEEHTKGTALIFSPDGKKLTSAQRGGAIQLWDVATGRKLQALRGHDGYIEASAFSQDGEKLASAAFVGSAASAGRIWLWDVATGTHLPTLQGCGGIQVIAFSPDGGILASASDSQVWLWDVATGSHLHTLGLPKDRIGVFAFSPDGRMLASTSISLIRVWDVATGTLLQALGWYNRRIMAVEFSPDGKTLASAPVGHAVRLWDVTKGTYLQVDAQPNVPGDSVCAMAFSPDGKTLAAASTRQTIWFWDVTTGSHLQTLRVHSLCNRLSFSSDGLSLETDRGLLRIDSVLDVSDAPDTSGASRGQRSPNGLFSADDDWITRGGKNLLLLPPQDRANCISAHHDTLAIAHRSGEVTIIQFVPPE